VYKKAGLFTDKSLFAHCIHLDKEDIDIFKTFNSSMIHCPCSNRFLASGIFKTREMLDDKVTIGLGTDVAGGYSLSMLNEMKECMESSKLATLFCGQKSEVSLTEAFYMATLGGAKALKLDDKIGNFQTGKEADFVVLSDTKINPFISLNVFQSPLERLKRMIYGGNKELVQDVFVRGKSIHVGEN
jgi:guanine deaminase